MDERDTSLSAVPCCANWIGRSYGKIEQQTSLDTVWNGPGAQEIRRLLAEGRQEELCEPDCPWLVSGRFGEETLTVIPGTPAFEQNQRLNNEEIRCRRVTLKSSPMAVRVIPTLHCNIRCRMCHQDHLGELALPGRFMADVRRIGCYIYDYQLHGGEVLVSPKLKEWVDPEWFRANPQLLLSLVTNGTNIPEKSWRTLESVRINYITVSINAATRETYRFITRADLFDKVLQNVIALRKLAQEHPLREFQIFLSFVLMRCNYSELPAFVRLANELRLPIHLLTVTGNESGESLYTDPPILGKVLDSINRSEPLSSTKGDRAEIARIRRTIQDSVASLEAGGIS